MIKNRGNFTLDRRFLGKNIRQAGTESENIISGYAVVWDSLSENLGAFYERFQYGAFDGAMSGQVVALFNHNVDLVLGRIRSKTLKVWSDATGLKFELKPPETSTARDLLVLLKRGDISGASVGFRVLKDRWKVEGGKNIRTIEAAELVDVSIVVFPANSQTSAAVRGGKVEEYSRAVYLSLNSKRSFIRFLEGRDYAKKN